MFCAIVSLRCVVLFLTKIGDVAVRRPFGALREYLARQLRAHSCQQAACRAASLSGAAVVDKRLDLSATSAPCCDICTAAARIQQTAAGAQLLASAEVDVVLLVGSEHARTALARCARVRKPPCSALRDI